MCPLCPQLAYLLSQFQYFVCPVGFNSETISFTVECEPSDIFVMQEYTLPAVLQKTLRLVRLKTKALPSTEAILCVLMYTDTHFEKHATSLILKHLFTTLTC